MSERKHWSLGAKLALVAAPFLVLAVLSIALTMWVSWQLEGGAAAVNEAGRMRMQAYRMALSLSTGATGDVLEQGHQFERSLELLRQGDPERPLFMPWDDTVAARFAAVERNWRVFRDRWASAAAGQGGPGQSPSLVLSVAEFSAHVDMLVAAIEAHLSRWTALLHLLQIAMMALAVLGAVVLLYMGYLFVLEPVGLLKRAIDRIEGGDFSARVDRLTSDEFGTLAEGFNLMAAHLQSLYQGLESKVREKTAELEEKRERLETLYDVTTLVAEVSTLDELAHGFTALVVRVSHADGVALRWSDEGNARYLMLASHGLPQAMAEGEHCIHAGECHCGASTPTSGARVIPIQSMAPGRMKHCEAAGFKTVVSVPVHVKERLMGELDLFFHAQISLSQAERSLLEALVAHLAGAMENLRLAALDKEAAVSQERGLLARELHDSIAQSLAFLKIQVQLMRDALRSGEAQRIEQVLEEIDLGVRESYSDVRELLLNFRTRTNAEDIEPALVTTLRKFELQSGMAGALSMQGHGLPLAPDIQIQVLHIVQEALSNVRKHAGATQVWVDVAQQPRWRFEVRDNGVGFVPERGAQDETHVGLGIMRERAERIGAQLDVISVLGGGSSVVLTLPLPAATHSAASPASAWRAYAPEAAPTAAP